MKNLTLQQLKEIQQQYNGPGGNEINNNFWARMLAGHFPEVTAEFDGEPVAIKFLGERFLKDPGGAVSEEMAEYEALFIPGFGHEYISKRYNADIGDEEAIRRAEKYSKEKNVPIYCVRKVRTSRRYLIHNMPF